MILKADDIFFQVEGLLKNEITGEITQFHPSFQMHWKLMVSLEAYIKHHRRVNTCDNHMGYSPSSPRDQMKPAIICTNSRLSVMENMKKGKKKGWQVPPPVNLRPVSTLQSRSLTPWTVALLCPWDFPGRNTRVGCNSFSRGSSWYPRIEPASPELAGGFFTTDPPRKQCQFSNQ